MVFDRNQLLKLCIKMGYQIGADKRVPKIEKLVIPEGFTIIGDPKKPLFIKDWNGELCKYVAFEGERLKTVKLPNSALKIGLLAFADCENLESIDIPDSVVEIGDRAFICCEKLKSVKLPKSLKKIDDDAFYDCPLSGTITIPESVTYIGHQAFSNISGKLELRVPVLATSFIDSFGGCKVTMY